MMAIVADLSTGAGARDASLARNTTRHPGYVSGRRYGPDTGGTNNTTAVAANTLYAIPFYMEHDARVSGMAMRVGTSVPGVLGRMGIYSHGADAKAARLLAETVSDVDMNAAPGEVMAMLASPLFMARRLYWLAACFNGGAQPTMYNFALAGGAGLSTYLGGTTIAHLNTGAASSRLTRNDALNYVTGQPFFPAEFGPSTVGVSSPASPHMAIIIN